MRSLASLVAVVILTTSCSSPGTTPEATDTATAAQPVVGGTEVAANDYPWMVSGFVDDGSGGLYQWGGAMLIDPTHLITAAHVVLADRWVAPQMYGEYAMDPATYFAVPHPASIAGVTWADAIPAKAIYVHPGVDMFPIDYDLAVVELSRPIYLDKYPDIADLDELDRWIKQRRTVRAMGWGYLNQVDFALPDVLYKVDLPLMPLEECQAFYNPGGMEVTATNICAGAMDGKGTCNGDSGGPLFMDTSTPQLVGVVSSGGVCGQTPDVYSNLPLVKKWVRQCQGGDCPHLTGEIPFCDWEFEDCDGIAENGCETFLNSTEHCGFKDCGAPSCSAGELCGYDLTSDAVGPSCFAAEPLVPQAQCVTTVDGKSVARFVVNNPYSRLLHFLPGPDNYFTGSASTPLDYFYPGENTVEAVLDVAGVGAWTLHGWTGSVSATTPACAP